jgi:pyruvyltransferase
MNYWNWRPQEKYRNFGDELTGLLLENIFPKQNHKWVEPEDADIVAVGSVLNTIRGRLKPGTAIWGSGGGYWPEDVEGLEVLAVRGGLTRDLCELPPDTPLGDPALLLPLYIEPAAKQYRLGLVRHMGDHRPHDTVGHDLEISCLQHPLDVIKQITSCERIVSSSLHGWIVAYAYGIPCVPVPLDDGNKFMDFMTSLGNQSLESQRERLLAPLLEWGSQRS